MFLTRRVLLPFLFLETVSLNHYIVANRSTNFEIISPDNEVQSHNGLLPSWLMGFALSQFRGFIDSTLSFTLYTASFTSH